MNKENPTTVAETVNDLLQHLTADQADELASVPEDSLIRTHFGIAAYVRNKYLYCRTGHLIIADGVAQGSQRHEDSVSAWIVKQAWARLRKTSGINN